MASFRLTGCVDQCCRLPLQVVGIDPVSGRNDFQGLKSLPTDSILDHLLPHHERPLLALTLELALIIVGAASFDDRVLSSQIDTFNHGQSRLFTLLAQIFGLVKEVSVPIVVMDDGLSETLGQNFGLLVFEAHTDVHHRVHVTCKQGQSGHKKILVNLLRSWSNPHIG